MDSQLPPNVKSDAPAATSGAGESPGGRAVTGAGGGPAGPGGGQAVRRFPRPPGFVPRFLMLCLRPETWAEAARYPTYITLIPLIFAIVVGAAVIATGETARLVQSLETFAADYDGRNHYPALELNSEGTLTAKGDLKSPIRLQLPTATILIDPTHKSSPDTMKVANTVFVTDKEIVFIGPEGPAMTLKIADVLNNPLSEFRLPKAGETKVIDAKSVAGYVASHKPYFAFSGVILALMQMVSEALWALLILFMLSPLVMMAAAGPRLHGEGPDRRLILPKRAAYRMVAAFLVPLVMVSSILRGVGHPVYDVLGIEGAMLFWFFAAAALCLWTGFMARRMYLPKDPRRAM